MAKEGDFPNSEVRAALRKAWTMSTSYQMFKKTRRIETERLKKDGTPHKNPSVSYKCDECNEITKESESAGKDKRGKPKRKLLWYIDHVEPVVDPFTGFQDWYTYWSRLYVDPSDWLTRLQGMCRYCHLLKTREEAALRKTSGSMKRDRPNT